MVQEDEQSASASNGRHEQHFCKPHPHSSRVLAHAQLIMPSAAPRGRARISPISIADKVPVRGICGYLLVHLLSCVPSLAR